MLNVNIQCFVVYALGWCWWTGGVSWRDAVRVKFCLFYSLSISAFFITLFLPHLHSEYVQNTSSYRRDRNALALCWLTAALIEDCEQITKAIYQHFVLHVDCEHIRVSVWYECVCDKHPHLLYVKQSGCRRSCQSEKNTMRSEGECARREQDGVNRVCVCVRIAWTRNKLISTICSQFRDGLPMYRSCARTDANFFFTDLLPMIPLVEAFFPHLSLSIVGRGFLSWHFWVN